MFTHGGQHTHGHPGAIDPHADLLVRHAAG
jgi:hypothetical protein